MANPPSDNSTQQKQSFPSDEQTRTKAHQLWLQRGDKSYAKNNWQDAMRMLRREQRIEQVVKPIRHLWWWSGLGSPFQQLWRWSGIKEKTGWDFAQLLAAPIVLALLGWGLQEYAKDRDYRQQIIDKEREQTQQQADREREQSIADDKARQDTLVKYLDQMADSLEGGLLTAKPGQDKFIVAQARTVIVLQSLDRKRQHLVIQFLSASGLSQASEDINLENFDPLGSEPLKLPDGDRVLLSNAQMEKADLAGSDLSGAIFVGANLGEASLGCNSSKSEDLSQCSDLSFSDFRGANLWGADLRSANLSGADLRSTDLWGADLSSTNLWTADLSLADLSLANLSNATLFSTTLHAANLSNTNLSNTTFHEADLSNANLSNANLHAANLSNANLSNTTFHEADLSNANLNGADLSNASLSDAILLTTDLRAIQYLTPEQLEGEHPPFLCNVALPQGITIDPDRDCDRIPQVWFERDPERFKTLKEAEDYINQARQETGEEEEQP